MIAQNELFRTTPTCSINAHNRRRGPLSHQEENDESAALSKEASVFLFEAGQCFDKNDLVTQTANAMSMALRTRCRGGQC